ncbi:MAG: CorA family divalent cation transporter [Candidatus Helarchaeota archaeon]
MVYILLRSEDNSVIKELGASEFDDDFLNNLDTYTLLGLDLYISDISNKANNKNWLKFIEETKILEKFFELKNGTISNFLDMSYRPALSQIGDTSIITLPYFSVLKSIKFDQSETFIPIETSTNHFLIIFKKPNKIATIRTDPKNYSFECVQIVMNWMQQIDLKQTIFPTSHLMDQIVVRLIDEIVDDNVELLRRYRLNVEILEQDIIRKTEVAGILEEILKLKSISMLLFSYVLSEKRFLTRIRSAAFPSLNMSDDVLSIIQTTLNEIETQIGIITDINRMISDILNIYSLMLQDRLNNVIKILTIFSVMFILPTFIVGFFGMNNFDVFGINPSFTIITTTILIISIIISILLLWRLKVFKKIGL